MLNEKGVDGILYDNGYEGEGKSYIALYPEQVVIVDDGKSNITNPYGPNTVGAAEYNPNSFGGLGIEHGIIKEGENPARPMGVPKKDIKGDTVSLFARTVLEAKQTPDIFVDTIENMVANGELSHEIITDKKALAETEITISEQGWEQSMKEWEAVVNGNKKATKQEIVLGQTLYNNAVNSGDFETAKKLITELCIEATRAGQSVQAFRALKKMTPQGKLYMFEKSVQALNRERLRNIQKIEAYKKITIPDDLVQELLQAEDSKAADIAVEKIEQAIADQIPATLIDKITAWRYLAMLGNLRTHVRNRQGTDTALFFVCNCYVFICDIVTDLFF